MVKQYCIGAGLFLLLATTEPLADNAFYRCTVDGRIILTDRPGSGDCQPFAASTSNTFKSEPAKTVTRSEHMAKAERRPKAAESSGDSTATERQKAKQRCEQIDQRLNEIAEKMRRGYTVRQGEALRVQRERLEASRRIAHCR